MEAALSDDVALRSMIELAEELGFQGVAVDFYQGGMKKSLEFMKNVYAAHGDTARVMGLEE